MSRVAASRRPRPIARAGRGDGPSVARGEPGIADRLFGGVPLAAWLLASPVWAITLLAWAPSAERLLVEFGAMPGWFVRAAIRLSQVVSAGGAFTAVGWLLATGALGLLVWRGLPRGRRAPVRSGMSS